MKPINQQQRYKFHVIRSQRFNEQHTANLSYNWSINSG